MLRLLILLFFGIVLSMIRKNIKCNAAVKAEHINNINDKYKKTDVENKDYKSDEQEKTSENVD